MSCVKAEGEEEKAQLPSRKVVDFEQRLSLNAYWTQYEVVRDVAEELNLRLICDEDEGEWDLLWIDGPVYPSLLMKMQPFQRVNHLPGKL